MKRQGLLTQLLQQVLGPITTTRHLLVEFSQTCRPMILVADRAERADTFRPVSSMVLSSSKAS